MILNAFTMASVSHLNYGLWRHPRDQTHRYKDIDYWVELARTLDEAGFDCLFLADALGQIDVYGQSPAAALRHGIQSPLIDPLLLVSAMAAATTSLGFGVTVSTTYEHPYLLARKFTTLDHLTKGRIGWNVVTSQQDSAARNLGLQQQIPHDERYARADEFMDVVYKLWLGSWDDDAVLRHVVAGDLGRSVYTDPDRVHPIRHEGRYFRVPDGHVAEPSPQRVPLLMQAGSSESGIRFAARHAEVVFVVGADARGTRQNVSRIREAAAAFGRDPSGLKFITAAAVVAGETDADARSRFDDYKTYFDPEGSVIHYASMTGVDFEQQRRDEALAYTRTEASQSVLQQFDRTVSGRSWSLDEATNPAGGFGRARTFVGAPGRIVDDMQAWLHASGTDVFNLIQLVNPDSYTDFIRLVAPELRLRGCRRERAAQPLRCRMFPQSTSSLPATDHPARRFDNLRVGAE